jgi:hypothetical protein
VLETTSSRSSSAAILPDTVITTVGVGGEISYFQLSHDIQRYCPSALGTIFNRDIVPTPPEQSVSGVSNDII